MTETIDILKPGGALAWGRNGGFMARQIEVMPYPYADGDSLDSVRVDVYAARRGRQSPMHIILRNDDAITFALAIMEAAGYPPKGGEA